MAAGARPACARWQTTGPGKPSAWMSAWIRRKKWSITATAGSCSMCCGSWRHSRACYTIVNGNMSDRGFLFLFSVFMIAAGGASAAYLVATGQAGTVDGLFLVLTALLLALVFALNVIYMLNRAM